MQPSEPLDQPSETLDILYRDDHLVVVNKPSGLLVHRSMIDRHETRFALQIVRDQIGQYVYPVHRLDKPTSGVLVLALSPDVARAMGELFQNHGTIEKSYLAVVRGFAPAAGTIDHPLTEQLDKITDKKAQQDKPAQTALTDFVCLGTVELPYQIDRYPTSRYSLVRAKPKTGRKHQIRRHLKHLAHPIIGDAKHGKGNHNRYFAEHLAANRLLLHCQTMAFPHPVTGLPLTIEAPLDETMTNLLTKFGWQQLI